MTELEKAARKCVFDELCVWCCKRVYTHCEYMAKTKDEPICKEGKVVHAKFIAGAQWQAKQSPWISVEDRLPDENQMVLCQMKSNNAIVSAYIYKNEEGNPQTATPPSFEFEDYQGYEPIRWMPIPE